jgi:hypothetical protein
VQLIARQGDLVLRVGDAAGPFRAVAGERTLWVFDRDDLRDDGAGELAFPEVLRDSLRGSGRLTVRASDDAEASADLVSAAPDGPLRLESAGGDALVINKWGHLARVLGEDPTVHRRLLDRVAALMDDLREFGLRPFVMGGTLLGPVREGRLLPHDDDADLGYLSSYGHPSDAALESFRLERHLIGLGYDVVRHSATHLQTYSRLASASFYIDVFGAFHDGRWFMQPFQVRAEIPREVFEDLRPIEVEGFSLDAPNPPEPWLDANYGPNWRTPDPAFRFSTPETTTRRYASWFGSLNIHRDHWNDRHSVSRAATAAPSRAAAELLSGTSRGVLELGFGLGDDAAAIVAAGRDWAGCDYSEPARVATAARIGARGSVLNHNLLDRRAVLDLVARFAPRAGELDLLAADVVGGLIGEGRANVLLIARHLLRGDARAVLSFPTQLGERYAFDDPDSWHWDLPEFITEAGTAGLAVDVLEHDEDGAGRTHALVALRKEA